MPYIPKQLHPMDGHFPMQVLGSGGFGKVWSQWPKHRHTCVQGSLMLAWKSMLVCMIPLRAHTLPAYTTQVYKGHLPDLGAVAVKTATNAKDHSLDQEVQVSASLSACTTTSFCTRAQCRARARVRTHTHIVIITCSVVHLQTCMFWKVLCMCVCGRCVPLQTWVCYCAVADTRMKDLE